MSGYVFSMGEFFLVWLFAVLSLGPNAVFVIETGVHHGFSQAFRAVLGICAVSFFYASLTGLGVAAFLAERPVILGIVSLFGALWILRLGFGLYRRAGRLPLVEEGAISGRDFILRGGLVAVSNPKAILAYVSILPNYLILSTGFFHYGLVVFLTVMAVFIFYNIYGYLGSLGRDFILRDAGFRRIFDYVAASFYAGIAFLIAKNGLALIRAG